METCSLELFKEYKKSLKKDPSSLVFAPLASLYQKIGESDKALEICLQGLFKEPSFCYWTLSTWRYLQRKKANKKSF